MAAESLLVNNEDKKEDLVANGMLAGVLLLGAIMTALIKADYRRQAACASSSPQ